jgi:hypothetical protein
VHEDRGADSHMAAGTGGAPGVAADVAPGAGGAGMRPGLARPTRRESRSARWRPQPGSPRPGCTRSRPGGPGRAGCRAGGAAGRGLAGARRLSALSGSAQQRYWRHADHSLWPVVQVSESHRENVQIGGSARGYQELFASLAAGQTRLQSRWPSHQGRIFIHRRSYRERTHLTRRGLPGRDRCWSSASSAGVLIVG